MHKIWAVFKARNVEFFRDKEALAWNLIMPIVLVLGIALAFSNGQREVFKVATVNLSEKAQANPLEIEHIQYIQTFKLESALKKLEQHQYDLVIQIPKTGGWKYWYNPLSEKSSFLNQFIEKANLKTSMQSNALKGDKIRYVDWVFPGILAINLMYGALYGIGYAIVRYRKNGYLKRLQATPLSIIEFLCAQVMSRLMISVLMMILIFIGCTVLLNPIMQGSYLLLLLLYILGAICMISLGLLLCARVTSEELSRGLLEMVAWPMLLISGAWFSLDQAHVSVQWFSQILPLTHLIHAAREVMLYGAGFADVQLEMFLLVLTSAVFLCIGALGFQWTKKV